MEMGHRIYNRSKSKNPMKLNAPPANWLIAAAVSFLMVGCANVGTERQAPSTVADRPEPGKGLVIFYRESKFAGGGVGFVVCDVIKPPSGGDLGSGPQIGSLPNGSYFTYNAKPGKHTFSGSTTARPATYYFWTTIESNKTYYVRAKLWGSSIGVPSHPDLTVVDPQEGLTAIKNLRPVTLSR